MPCPPSLPPPPAVAAPARRHWLRRAVGLWLGGPGLAALRPVQAERIDLLELAVRRTDSALVLDYQARLQLSGAVEEALRRGVPVYFAAEARLLRRRWYWRDERVARISRQWRMSYQPLTANWRLTLGGLSQVHASMAEALAVISRVAGWRLAELSQLDADVDHYLEFSLQLDTTQLPRPMQIDLGGDWKLGVERTMELR
ncbi:MAG: hypothetical protein RLY78_2059 [Pseudomonadota bacterium]